MDKQYIIYKCNECGKHFLLLEEEADHNAGYLSCPRHGKHRDISVIGACDDLLECATKIHKKDTYKKVGNKTVQTRWG